MEKWAMYEWFKYIYRLKVLIFLFFRSYVKLPEDLQLPSIASQVEWNIKKCIGKAACIHVPCLRRSVAVRKAHCLQRAELNSMVFRPGLQGGAPQLQVGL